MKFTTFVAASAFLVSASFANAGTLNTELVVDEPVEPVAVEEESGGSIGSGIAAALVILAIAAIAAVAAN